MKSLRERMDIVNAYAAVGTYRGAAALCGTTHKTVKRVLDRRQAGQPEPRAPQTSNTVVVEGLIAKRIETTDGRISAKRLLPLARKDGYTGSARNFRRAVARAKAAWKRERRTYRPWIPVPGEHLVIDWAKENGRNIFSAVLWNLSVKSFSTGICPHPLGIGRRFTHIHTYRSSPMAGKANFTEAEWQTLEKGVSGAGMLVALADASFFDSFKEIGAMAGYLAEASQKSSVNWCATWPQRARRGPGSAHRPRRSRPARSRPYSLRWRPCTPKPPTRPPPTSSSCSASRSLWPTPYQASSPPRAPRSTRSKGCSSRVDRRRRRGVQAVDTYQFELTGVSAGIKVGQ